METSATIGAIAGAIVAVQSALKPAEKDATNPAFRSRYATLLSVWDSCREALGKAGVAVVQTPTAAPAGHAAIFSYKSALHMGEGCAQNRSRQRRIGASGVEGITTLRPAVCAYQTSMKSECWPPLPMPGWKQVRM